MCTEFLEVFAFIEDDSEFSLSYTVMVIGEHFLE